MCLRRRAPRRTEYTRKRKENACKKKALQFCVCWHFLGLFCVPANPTAKKSPKGPPRAPPGPSRGPARRVTSVYCSLLGRSKADLGAKMGPRMVPIIAQKSTSAPKARPRAPKSRREAQKDPQEAPGGPNSRPSEAHKHTKKLFENTGQKVFRRRFTQDPPKVLGSVAGIGGAAPLEIRPLSL